MRLSDVPPDELAEYFNAFRDRISKSLFSSFGIDPSNLGYTTEREYKMSHQNPWPSSRAEENTSKFVARYGLIDVISGMVASGRAPAYIIAHPDVIKKELRIGVSMAGFDMGKVGIPDASDGARIGYASILGVPLVASITVTNDTVIVADRLSIIQSLGVKERNFEAFDIRLPILIAAMLA